jgi:glycine/D-amino acid oxidase-like deaminating enzyme
MTKKICIIGSGVIGLSCAYEIASKYSHDEVSIAIISSSFQEADTTSYGSAGLWKPNLIEGTPEELVNTWGKQTFEFFLSLYYSQDAGIAGISFMDAYHLFQKDQLCPEPFWKDVVIGFRSLTQIELDLLKVPKKYTNGYTYKTCIAQQSLYLQYLKRKIGISRLTCIEKRVNDINEAINLCPECDVYINCTGLGSYHIMNDESVYPIRGQVVRVDASWMKNIWFFDTSYIIPNVTNVVLGGTADVNNWDDKSPVEATTTKIVDDISVLFPAMKSAQVVYFTYL